MLKLDDFVEVEEVLQYLRKHNYTYSFRCGSKGWHCVETGKVFFPEELVIDASQRFRQNSGANAFTIVYAVRTPCGRKGVILDNCSTYGNRLFGDFVVRMKLQQLLPHPKRPQ